MPIFPRHFFLILLLAAPQMTGCFRTLRYPSQAQGPDFGEQVEALKQPTAKATPPKTNNKSKNSEETWATSNKVAPSSSSAKAYPGQGDVAARATAMMGDYSVLVDGKRFRMDCSGFVRGVFYGEGVDLFSNPGRASVSGTEYIYRYAQKEGKVHRGPTAKAGDLVFFHNTYDRNHNKKRDDRFTHVAIVESITRDGTMSIIHAINGRVRRYHMNLRQPNVHRDPKTGATLNDYLRRAEGGHPSMLMSQLFTAFGQVATPGSAS